MLHALSAATSALDLLKSLTASKSQSAGNKQEPKSPFDLSPSSTTSETSSSKSGVGASAQITPATMSALLAAQSQATTGSAASSSTSRSDALKDLFAQIDADSDGKLSKSEFENALGAGGTNLKQADSVFGKLDKDGDGAVSLDEMMSALKGKGHRRHDTAGSDGTGARQGSADAGIGGRILDLGHQQRWLGHDVADLCRRLQGDDDIGRVSVGIQCGDLIL